MQRSYARLRCSQVNIRAAVPRESLDDQHGGVSMAAREVKRREAVTIYSTGICICGLMLTEKLCGSAR